MQGCVCCGAAADFVFGPLKKYVCSPACQRKLWNNLDDAEKTAWCTRLVVEATFPRQAEHAMRFHPGLSNASVHHNATGGKCIGDTVAVDGAYTQNPTPGEKTHKDQDRFSVNKSGSSIFAQQDGSVSSVLASAEFGSFYAAGVFDGHGVSAVISNGLGAKNLQDLFEQDAQGEWRILDEARLADTFIMWDTDFLAAAAAGMHSNARDIIHSGSTATLLLATRQELQIVHVGDSLAFVYVRSATKPATFLLAEHDPFQLEERQRIRQTGGLIGVHTAELVKRTILLSGDEIDVNFADRVATDLDTDERIDRLRRQSVRRLREQDEFVPEVVLRAWSPGRKGGLAMTRSFGDFTLKRDFLRDNQAGLAGQPTNRFTYEPNGTVSVVPSVFKLNLATMVDDGDDVYIVVASDGLWDYMYDARAQVQRLIDAIIDGPGAENAGEPRNISLEVRDELFKVVLNGWDDNRGLAKLERGSASRRRRRFHDDTTIMVTRFTNISKAQTQ